MQEFKLLFYIFIGGFIFHLFWEAKGQYTITYFVLLIPYCVKGLMDMTDEIADGILNLERHQGVFGTIKMLWKLDSFKYIALLFGSTVLLHLIVRGSLF